MTPDEPHTDNDTHEKGEMSFLEHLEELRWRVIKILVGIILGMIVCWIFIDWIMNNFLLQPIITLNSTTLPGRQPIRLQNLKPFGQLFLYFQVAAIGGILLSIPNLLYHLWAFIAPGLLPKERKYIKYIVIFSSLCFLGGVAFAYFVMLPAALQFFAGFGTAAIENNIAINEYMNFIISVMLAAGVVFELPMVSWFLSKLGILTPKFMRKYRRHAIVGIFILAAVLTPGTDPVSQILLAAPLMVLYEISILVSAWAGRGNTKKDEEKGKIHMPDKATDLKDIAAPIQPHLEVFERVFRESIRSKIGLVDLVTKYIIRQKGKRVRPILVLLSADLCGPVTEKTYRGASLVEILHTATLIHDDVVDNADTRRGLASINAIWKNKIAVLMGDYLLSRGLLLSLENDDFQFLKITSTSVRRMSEGELHQIQKSRKLDLDEPTYLKIIGDKTASLLSTCCEIGATSASTDPEHHRLLREYGEHVGLAFQIRDDILDYTGRKSITGKPTGLDLSEKKLTLPMIHALTKAPRSEGRDVLTMIRQGGKKINLRALVRFVTDYGGIDYASAQAQSFAETAKQRLASFPESAAKRSLEAFADFVVEREK